MKLKATKKEMKNGYYKIVTIGYCNAEALLSRSEPIAYSSGVYGWACDYYEIDGVLISTGYDPLSPKNSRRDYELTREYNEKARAIQSNYQMPYDEQKRLINELLSEYVKKVTE
jgi:hypothetical protein